METSLFLLIATSRQSDVFRPHGSNAAAADDVAVSVQTRLGDLAICSTRRQICTVCAYVEAKSVARREENWSSPAVPFDGSDVSRLLINT